MSQTKRITALSAKEADNAYELFDRFAADGQFDPNEIAEMREALDRVVFITGRADLATALAVCVNRGGPDGWRINDLMRQWQELEHPSDQKAAA